MLNPIFHSETRFLDQAADGSLSYRSGTEPGLLEGGVRIQAMATKQPLFTIETESGARLTLTPESVFALRKTPDGRLIRYVPIDDAFAANPPLLDWAAPLAGQIKEDIRRFALTGMICASGTHSTDRQRPSNMTLVEGSVADDVANFLLTVADQEGHGSVGRAYRPTIRRTKTESTALVFVKSRTLTRAASWLIEPKTQQLRVDLMSLSREASWAFAFGLINGAMIDDRNAIIRHRSLDTVQRIAEMLELRFGITTNMEVASDKAPKDRVRGHVLAFTNEALTIAARIGLLRDYRSEGSVPGPFRPEKIARIISIETRSPAVIVTGERTDIPFPLAANGFVFDSVFEPNQALVELAAHPVMMTDPSDPTDIMKTAPRHIVKGQRIHA
ncbi:hypothetical protein KEU06_08740 [Pseudaminobacter sp. 19-2017]|uniref:Uncharacterized protein n=1 Tax=Pseudaminobacter soli (ex Zhang et al. 2022) TaxID=2831468 RepID=A0A942DW64_9HYPH|nr:hypothetical protein [Pseudaminobacter soli]MBS3648714.1 hypothetical protein [Pseudaminobacter soli]